MEPFRHHVFVCTQQKAEGVTSCPVNNSLQVVEALRKEIAANGLSNDVQLNTCSCLGLCDSGPIMITYPEGVWYAGIKPQDAAEIVASHLRDGKPVSRLLRADTSAMRAEILDHRDKYLAAMKARDAAGVLPDDLNQLTRAFMESRAVLTALELDIFSKLGSGATAAQVANAVGGKPHSTEMLLNALVSLGLLQKKDGLFSNTPVTARYFAAGSRDDARPSLMHTVHLWKRWSTLTDCVLAGTAVDRTRVAERGDTWTQAFIAAMHRNASERAPFVLKAVLANGDQPRRMLDLGGGSGAYSIAFAKAVPELRAEILDLETVLPLTKQYIADAGVADRVSTRVGDLRTDASFGSGYDLVLISAICHMFSPDENRSLLRRALNALAPGGRVVVQDFILEADKTSPRFGALFALNMLVSTDAGDSYSEPEYAAWMNELGFKDVRRVRLPGPSDLMIGRK